MYTYIYTENHMNFYREGTVINFAAGQEILMGATFKHKAVFFPNQTASSVNQFKLTFWGADATGVTLAVPAVTTGAQTPCVFPGTVRSILSTQASAVVLLN